MRVLRVSHSAVVTAWRARERAIAARGPRVSLFTAKSWNEGGALVVLRAEAGEDVSGIRTFGTHPALFLYDPRPLWRALGEPWDVIDIHEEPFALSTAEVLLLRLLRRQRAPYVLYSAQNLRKRYPIPFRWLERWSLRGAAGVSVCNVAAGAIVQDKGYPGTATVIPLGMDKGRFAPSARMPVPHEHIVAGYAGRFEPHKGVEVLLRAAALDKRMVLRLAGAGPNRASLQATVRELGISNRVEFVGSVEQAALADFYHSLDVLAVPSLVTPRWVEQFGRVAAEAMACGTPVIASNSGALPDIVRGAGRLVPPGDPAALAKALLDVVVDRAATERLRVEGLARVASMDWESVADDYVKLYERAVARARPAPDVVTKGRQLEVIVVAYGSPDLLHAALAPLDGLPILVVDNSSSADIRDIAARHGARYVDPGRNGGFAAGVNEGLRHRLSAESDVLLLNPDAVIDRCSIDRLQRCLIADPGLASVGPSQVDIEGHPARVLWPFPSPLATWLEAFGLAGLRHRDDYVIGSVLLLRAEALAHVGGFDERFFLYAEETDWARRAAALGWRHALVPEVTARHVGAGTSSDPVRRESVFHASQERYLRKHYGTAGWQIARAGQVAGSALRAVILRGNRGQLARRRLLAYIQGPVRAQQLHESSTS